MPIMQTQSGSWRVQLERYGRREYRTFPTRRSASHWEQIRRSELLRGEVETTDRARRTPFSVVIIDYRKRVLPSKKNRSYRWTLDRLERCFGRRRVLEIRADDVAEFCKERLAEGRKPATVRKELGLFRKLLDHARTKLKIHLPRNVARDVPNPEGHTCDGRNRVFVGDEEARLMAEIRLPALRRLVIVALETAARQGELLRAESRHLNLEARTLFLAKTKNGDSREIPLSRKAVTALREMRGLYPGARVFGCWASGDSVRNAYKRALCRARKQYRNECEAVGVECDEALLRDLRFHDFRHIATSRLARKFTMLELGKITGHKDPKSLFRYYHPVAAELALRMDD